MRTTVTRGPLAAGHRGESGLAPENTAASFARARAAGADMVETDVRLSADGELFLFHDSTGTRTTNVAQVFPDRAEDPITSFTAAELRQLDAGAYFGRQFAGERVLFLDELPAAVDFALRINLEMKAPQDSPGLEQALADALTGREEWAQLLREQRIAVSCFDPAALRAFYDAAPAVPVWQLVQDVPAAAALADGARWVQGVVADHRFLTAEGSAAVRAAGLGLWVYTVNGSADTHRVLKLGVDAVITDFPGSLVDLLEQDRSAQESIRSTA